MGNKYQPKVQQKLAHSRLLLEMLSAHPERQAVEALRQSAVIHLAIAARLFLRELAEYLGHPDAGSVEGPRGLQGLPQASGVISELQANPWLQQLWAVERNLLARGGEHAAAAGNLITSDRPPQADDNGPVSLEFSEAPEVIWQWLHQLTELSERMRQIHEEF